MQIKNKELFTSIGKGIIMGAFFTMLIVIANIIVFETLFETPISMFLVF